MVGGGSCVVDKVFGSGDFCVGDEASSSSEELIERVGARAGADLRRGAAVEAFALEAGRGGLKAGALRFCAGFDGSGMIDLLHYDQENKL